MPSQLVVPFGFGVGDIFDVTELAVGVYNRVHECTDEYRQLDTEARRLSDLLQSLGELSSNLKLSDKQRSQIAEWTKDSKALLDQMNNTLDRHNSLAGDGTKLSQRFTWKKAAVNELRSRLTAHVVMLNASIFLITQTAVMNALPTVKSNIKEGRTKPPSVSSISQGSQHEDNNDTESDWSEITRDLESLGITPAMAKTHRELIRKYFETAIASGELPDGAYSDCAHNDEKAMSPAGAASEEIDAWLESNTGEIHEPSPELPLAADSKHPEQKMSFEQQNLTRDKADFQPITDKVKLPDSLWHASASSFPDLREKAALYSPIVVPHSSNVDLEIGLETRPRRTRFIVRLLRSREIKTLYATGSLFKSRLQAAYDDKCGRVVVHTLAMVSAFILAVLIVDNLKAFASLSILELRINKTGYCGALFLSTTCSWVALYRAWRMRIERDLARSGRRAEIRPYKEAYRKMQTERDHLKSLLEWHDTMWPKKDVHLAA